MSKIACKRRILATIIIVAASTLTVATADARSRADRGPPSVKVSYADLNLQRPEGAKTLYRRLQAAARQVCSTTSTNRSFSLGTKKNESNCYRDALSAAVTRIDNVHLTQLHNS